MRFILVISSIVGLSAQQGLQCSGADQDWLARNSGWKTDLSNCVSVTESAVECLVNSRVVYELSGGCRSCIAGAVKTTCSTECTAGGTSSDCETCLETVDFAGSCDGYVPPADCASDTTSTTWSNIVGRLSSFLKTGGALTDSNAPNDVGLTFSCYTCVTKSLGSTENACIQQCQDDGASMACVNCSESANSVILGVCDPQFRYLQPNTPPCGVIDESESAWINGLTAGLSTGLDVMGNWNHKQVQSDLMFGPVCFDCLYANMDIACIYTCSGDGATSEACTNCASTLDSKLKDVCTRTPPPVPSAGPTCTGLNFSGPFTWGSYNAQDSSNIFTSLAMCPDGPASCLGSFTRALASLSSTHAAGCDACIGNFFASKGMDAALCISECMGNCGGCDTQLIAELFDACDFHDGPAETSTTTGTMQDGSTETSTTTGTIPDESTETSSTTEGTSFEGPFWHQCGGVAFTPISWEVEGHVYSTSRIDDIWSNTAACMFSSGPDPKLAVECIIQFQTAFLDATSRDCGLCLTEYTSAVSSDHDNCLINSCGRDTNSPACASCVSDLSAQFMTDCNIIDSETSGSAHVLQPILIIAALVLIPLQ